MRTTVLPAFRRPTMLLFELYDWSCDQILIHLEMTRKESELRNSALQEKGSSRRWQICNCLFPGNTQIGLNVTSFPTAQ